MVIYIICMHHISMEEPRGAFGRKLAKRICLEQVL